MSHHSGKASRQVARGTTAGMAVTQAYAWDLLELNQRLSSPMSMLQKNTRCNKVCDAKL